MRWVKASWIFIHTFNWSSALGFFAFLAFLIFSPSSKESVKKFLNDLKNVFPITSLRGPFPLDGSFSLDSVVVASFNEFSQWVRLILAPVKSYPPSDSPLLSEDMFNLRLWFTSESGSWMWPEFWRSEASSLSLSVDIPTLVFEETCEEEFRVSEEIRSLFWPSLL